MAGDRKRRARTRALNRTTKGPQKEGPVGLVQNGRGGIGGGGGGAEEKTQDDNNKNEKNRQTGTRFSAGRVRERERWGDGGAAEGARARAR
jgi:hypothetical protein